VATTMMGLILSRSASRLDAGSHAFVVPLLALSVLQLLVFAAAMRLPLSMHAPADLRAAD